MPPLKACGRHWHIASDDLPVPSLLGLVFHAAWAIWILAVFVQAGSELVGCGNPAISATATLLLFCAFVLTCCIQAWLAYESWQGSIMDEPKRRRVPLALACLAVSYMLELGALVYATVAEARLSAMPCYNAEQVVHFSALALILSTWVVFGAMFVLLILLYNIVPTQSMEGWVDRCRCLGRLPCCRDGLASSNVDADGVPGDPPLLRLARVFGDLFTAVDFTFSDAVAALMLVGIIHKEHAHGSPMAAAAAAAEVVEAAVQGMAGGGDFPQSADSAQGPVTASRSFVPGPKLPPAVAQAAVACLRQRQRRGAVGQALHAGGAGGGSKAAVQAADAADAAVSIDDNAAATADGSGHVPLRRACSSSSGDDPGSSSGNCRGDKAGGMAANSTGMRHDSSGSAQDVQIREAEEVPLPLLEEALHWHRFANAIYGWPMYLWSRRYRPDTFCCGLCVGRVGRCLRSCTACGEGSCCLPTPRSGARPGAPLEFAPQLTREAIVQTAHIPEEDLLHLSLVNKMEGLLPYMLVLDRSTRSVVLAVRGSLSAEDVVTDLLFDPAPLEADWVMAPGQQQLATNDATNSNTDANADKRTTAEPAQPVPLTQQALQQHSSCSTAPSQPSWGHGPAPATGGHPAPTSERSAVSCASSTSPRMTSSDRLMAAGRTGSGPLEPPPHSSFPAVSATPSPRESSSLLGGAPAGLEQGIDAAHGLSDEALASRAVSTSDVADSAARAASTGADKRAAGAAETAGVAAAAAAGAEAARPGRQQQEDSATKDKWYAHGAILSSARCIMEDLRGTQLLDDLLLHGHASTPGRPPGDVDGLPQAGASTSGRGTSSSRRQGSAPGQGVSNGKSISAKAGAGNASAGMRSQQLPDCRGWKLVVTGHSLGAGVAALLALHLRTVYPNVRCWCFAPPGGLLSPAAAASLDDICYSLVSAKDMMPRLSLWTMEKLRDEMMLAAIRCKVPKVDLLMRALLGKKWTEADAMVPLDQLPQAKWEWYRQYAVRVEQDRALDPLRVCIAREMIPPGHIIWLERHKGGAPAAHASSGSNSRVPPVPARDGAARCTGLRRDDSGYTEASSTVDSSSNLLPDGTNASADTHGQSSSGLQSDVTHSGKGLNVMFSPLLPLPMPVLPSLPVLTRSWLTPHWTNGGSLIVGGLIVSKSMFADHVPDSQYLNFKRMVRSLQKEAAAAAAPQPTRAAAAWRRMGSGLALHRSPSSPGPPSPAAAAVASNRAAAPQATSLSCEAGTGIAAVGAAQQSARAGQQPVPHAALGWFRRGRAGAASAAASTDHPEPHDVEMGYGSGKPNNAAFPV